MAGPAELVGFRRPPWEEEGFRYLPDGRASVGRAKFLFLITLIVGSSESFTRFRQKKF